MNDTMTNENRCEPPPEWQLMAYECVPPQVVADDLLGVLADLAHNPTADATIINTLRRARANVQMFTPPATVAALVDVLKWYARDYDHHKGLSQWDGGTRARQVLALYWEAVQ